MSLPSPVSRMLRRLASTLLLLIGAALAAAVLPACSDDPAGPGGPGQGETAETERGDGGAARVLSRRHR